MDTHTHTHTHTQTKVIMGGYGCVNQDYCGNHSIYMYQIITLYTLNLHNVMYQLYLNKVGEKNIPSTHLVLHK